GKNRAIAQKAGGRRGGWPADQVDPQPWLSVERFCDPVLKPVCRAKTTGLGGGDAGYRAPLLPKTILVIGTLADTERHQ
ncbi:MAG: hypothetical protein RLZZ563_1645, partial [Pseudomonadota bacterium]